jgi:parallel beta-helix repeat protein
MRRMAAVCVVVAIAVTVVDAASAVEADGVECGDVITSSTVLERDLTCPGDGLLIRADNITLDLGGHTVTGSLRAGTVGIDNPGYDNVTITNGFVDEFQSGVVVRAGAKRNRLAGLKTRSHTRYGIALFNSHDNLLRDNVALFNGTT